LASRAVISPAESWFFPTPWLNGPEISPGKWEYCCFRLPGIQERIFVKICTTIQSEWHSDVPNDMGALRNEIYGEDAGYFSTSFHSDLPAPSQPAQYGFEIFNPIVDPEGPLDKSDPSWSGFGQWMSHKIGGAPYLRATGPVIEKLHSLLCEGYELLLQLSEPNWNIEDPQQCDDYPGDEDVNLDGSDWLFDKDDFSLLVHPKTLDVRFVWGR